MPTHAQCPGGLNGWGMDAHSAANQQSAPLHLPDSGLAMTCVPLAPYAYPMQPADVLSGEPPVTF